MYKFDNNNQVIATITHNKSIDTPLSITNKNGTFYYHRDHQGSIVALTDQTGAVVESFTYDNHYGIITNHTKTIETNNPYGYTARVVDTPELYYYRARYYDPELQRFISPDPIRFASGDFNWYRYVGNDPVGLRDPWGLFKFCISLKNEIRNLTEEATSEIWWKMWGSPQQNPKGSNIVICWWDKYQRVIKSCETRSVKLCFGQDEPDPCIGRTPSNDIWKEYGEWEYKVESYDKKIDSIHKTLFVGMDFKAHCYPPDN